MYIWCEVQFCVRCFVYKQIYILWSELHSQLSFIVSWHELRWNFTISDVTPDFTQIQSCTSQTKQHIQAYTNSLSIIRLLYAFCGKSVLFIYLFASLLPLPVTMDLSKFVHHQIYTKVILQLQITDLCLQITNLYKML